MCRIIGYVFTVHSFLILLSAWANKAGLMRGHLRYKQIGKINIANIRAIQSDDRSE